MVKLLSAAILSFLLVSPQMSFAKEGPPGNTKVYSGFLHLYVIANEKSYWQSFLGKKSDKEEELINDMQCSVEFKSTVPFTRHSVVEVPEELTYLVKFKNSGEYPNGYSDMGKGFLDKYTIVVYTKDDEAFSIEPFNLPQENGIRGEHHIYDLSLISLIMGQGIDHLEIVSATGDDRGKYILDKLEVHNNG